MNMEIRTDNRWKEFKYENQVPKSVLEEYDWLDEEEKSYGWICYKRRWYHISDFLSLHNKVHMPNNPFPKPWDGYLSDSFFSGVLIHIHMDSYRIGTYLS